MQNMHKQQRNYTIDWSALSNEELNLLNEITQRAVLVARENKVPLSPLHTLTSLGTTQIHHPLRLRDLLAADEDELMHEVLGIVQNLDPDTGRLEGLFSPRFTDHRRVRQADAANEG